MQIAFLVDSLPSIVPANRALKEFEYCNPPFPLNDATLTKIPRNFRILKKLSLRAKRLTESTLLGIMECKALKSIEFQSFTSASQDLAMLSLCRTWLKEFSLTLANGVTYLDLECLMYSNNELERINLSACSGPNSKGLYAIGLYSNFQYLDVGLTVMEYQDPIEF